MGTQNIGSEVGGVTPETTNQVTVKEGFLNKPVTTFDDAKPVVSTEIRSVKDSTFSQSASEETDLGKFLSRPALIGTYTWTKNVPFSADIFPLYNLFDNVPIKAKLANYLFIRADIKMKIVINSTPFNYGLLLANLVPRIRTVDTHPYNVLALSENFRIRSESQRPNVYLDINDNSSVEITMPFFYPKNYFNMKDDDPLEYCKLTIRQMADGLKTATSEATSSVGISVFAWFENVELAGPTFFQLQSDIAATDSTTFKVAESSEEEYKTSTVSDTAFAVSRALGQLRNVPTIGPYALATSMLSNSVGKVAKAFGFSKPTFAGDTTVVRTRGHTSFANTNSNDTARKLTYDVKQQTTIDSRVVGLDKNDDMLLSTILSRESYIGGHTWATNRGTDDVIMHARVMPCDMFVDTVSDQIEGVTPTVMSSLGYGSLPFVYWSGTINYRLKIVASKYHRGRLRISYDPEGNAPTSVSFNPVFSYVVDLDTCREIEFSVSWCNDHPYLNVAPATTVGEGQPLDNTQPAGANGTLFFTVLNPLSAPDPDAFVSMLLFHKAGSDFEVFNPVYNDISGSTPGGCTNYPYLGEPPEFNAKIDETNENGDSKTSAKTATIDAKLQSGIAKCEEDQLIPLVGTPTVETMEKKAMIFHGDPVVSLRQILRRYEFCTGSYFTHTDNINRSLMADDLVHPYPTFNRFSGRRHGEAGVFNDVNTNKMPTSFFAYFTAGYAGYRGGVRVKARTVLTHIQGCGYRDVRRSAGELDFVTDTVTNSTHTAPTNIATAISLYSGPTTGAEGMETFDPNEEQVQEFEFPYHSKYRFIDVPLEETYDHNTGAYDPPSNASMWGTNWIRNKVMFHFIRTNPENMVQALTTYYTAPAEDFNLIWYLGCPFFATSN